MRRPALVLLAVVAGLMTGCDCFCKKKGGNDWSLAAARGANGSGLVGGGSGATGGGAGGGGGGGGGGGQVPEIHPGTAVGVLTLVAGSILILRDRRRLAPTVECT